MAEEALRVKIGVDITDLNAGLSKAVTSINKFSKSLTGESLKNFGKDLKIVKEGFDDLYFVAGKTRSLDVAATKIDKVGDEAKQTGVEMKQAAASVSQFASNVKKSATAASASNAFGKISANAKGAVNSINALGQVARDLPFGFIAIQNNLPILADQLTSLVSSSGGALAAFKSLGAALIGPAGITLAIGAVIAGATALIQKYGSLGEALDAISKSGDKAFKQQLLLKEVFKDANKEAGEQIAVLKDLATTAANTAQSDDVRRDAIKKLRDEYGPYLKNLSDEDILNGKLTSSIAGVVQQLRNKALATAAVAKAGELAAQQLDFLQKEEKLTANILALQNRQAKERGKFRTTQGGTTDLAAETQRTINALDTERDALVNSRKEVEKNIDALFDLSQTATKAANVAGNANKKQLTEAEKLNKKVNEEKLKGYEAELKSIERVFGATSSQYLALSKKIANTRAEIKIVGETDPNILREVNTTLVNELADINTKLTETQREEEKKRLQFSLKRYEAEAKAAKEAYGSISQDYLDAQKKIASAQAQVDISVAIGNKDFTAIDDIKKELNDKLDNLDEDFRQRRFIEGSIEFTPILKVNDKEALERLRKYRETVEDEIRNTTLRLSARDLKEIKLTPKVTIDPKIQANLDALDEAKSKLTGLGATLFKEFEIPFFLKFGNSEESTKALSDISEKAMNAYNSFNNFLAPAIDTVFGALENGQSVAKALGQSFKALIVQLGLAVVKALAFSAIIQLIPGIGQLTGLTGGFSKIFGAVLKGGLGIGQSAAPNFSGVQSGGFAVQVGGSFNLRGTDLVASINQSNQRIGRVG